jgi:hypothetical protein
VRYLGRIAGSGRLKRGDEILGRAAYDFDGFTGPRGGYVSSGEIRLEPSDLQAVFGPGGVQLLTDDGRLLDLRFSQKKLDLAADVAHVEVTGDLPRTQEEWRAGSAIRSGSDVAPG